MLKPERAYKVIKILWTAVNVVNTRPAVAKSLKVLGQAATATYQHSNVSEEAFPRNQAFSCRKYYEAVRGHFLSTE